MFNGQCREVSVAYEVGMNCRLHEQWSKYLAVSLCRLGSPYILAREPVLNLLPCPGYTLRRLENSRIG
jgi:hypothetical protein